MTEQNSIFCTAFEGSTCIASGEMTMVVRRAKEVLESNPEAAVLIFNDLTSEFIEVDFRGTIEDVLKRLGKIEQPNLSHSDAVNPDKVEPRGPGRPKLGVIAREVTLLPRHWEWLNTQPGGASVAIRKLVEKARRDNVEKDQIRQAQESCYRFMSRMAGNQAGFEEATRALFAGNQVLFSTLIKSWPNDIKKHTEKLATSVFG